MPVATLPALFLAFSVTGGAGLWSAGDGGVVVGGSTSANALSDIVFDAGDGVLLVDGAGDTYCDKTGCYAGTATIELPDALTGDGVVVLGGGALGFQEVSGLGTEFLTAVADSLGGQDFELFPELASGIACGIVTESPNDDLTGPFDPWSIITESPIDDVASPDAEASHEVKSPRDAASFALRVSDEGEGGGLLAHAYGVSATATGNAAGATSADTHVLCAAWDAWEGTSMLVSAAVVSLRSADHLADAPNRVSGTAVLGFMDYSDDG